MEDTCRRKYQAGYRAANRQRRKEYMRQWFTGSPGKKKLYSLTSRYGLAPGEFAARWIAQAGRCLLCHKQPPVDGPRRSLAVDHDHGSGKVRGLLCMRCNAYLGWFEGRRELVEDYLRV